jgi:hypothetical protein
MSLKKDITEQTALIKLQQDQIVQLTFERDAARAESKRLRASFKDIGKKSLEDGRVVASEHTILASSEENRNNHSLSTGDPEQLQVSNLIL